MTTPSTSTSSYCEECKQYHPPEEQQAHQDNEYYYEQEDNHHHSATTTVGSTITPNTPSYKVMVSPIQLGEDEAVLLPTLELPQPTPMDIEIFNKKKYHLEQITFHQNMIRFHNEQFKSLNLIPPQVCYPVE